MVLCPLCLEDIAHSYFPCAEIKNVWSYACTVPYIYVYIQDGVPGILTVIVVYFYIFCPMLPC